MPIIAAGNSDGNLQMLTYTNDNNKVSESLEILVHHDDGVREYSYDKELKMYYKKPRTEIGMW